MVLIVYLLWVVDVVIVWCMLLCYWFGFVVGVSVVDVEWIVMEML